MGILKQLFNPLALVKSTTLQIHIDERSIRVKVK